MPYKNKNKKREYDKKYRQKPEVIKRKKEYGKKYHQSERYKKYINSKERKDYNKEYNQRPEVKERIRENYKKNRKKIRKQQKEYRKNNPEKTKKQKREDYQKHKETRYKYLEKNKDKIKEKQREYHKQNKKRRNNIRRKREKEDKQYNIKHRLRTNLTKALNFYTKTGKIMSSKKYEIDYLKIIEHLKPFPKNLKNYQIHHIKPLHTFNFVRKDGSTDLKEVSKAFYPKNHKWVTKKEHNEIHRKLNGH